MRRATLATRNRLSLSLSRNVANASRAALATPAALAPPTPKASAAA